jgi:polyribonucleotide nucleotidyltransferase
MVEAGMNNVSEEEVVEALQFGHKHIRMLVAHQLEMVKALGKEKFAYESFAVPAEDIDEAMAVIGDKIKAALVIPQKLEKYAAIDKLGEEFLELMKEKVGEEEYAAKEGHYKNIYHEVEKAAFRNFTIDSKTRIDGRSYTEVRPIDIEHALLPMTHGSALFTRGETQALVVATLGTKMDTQILDNIDGEGRKHAALQLPSLLRW